MKARATYHHGDLRRAVIAEALAAVDAGQAITMRGVARAVEVNHRAVAHEFVDLRGLKAALSLEVLEAMRQELARVDLEALTLRDQLLALAVAYARFGVEHPRRYEMLFGPRLNLDGRHPELEAGFQAIFDPFHTLLHAACARGELREHDAFAETLKLGSAVHGFVHLVSVGRLAIPEGHIETWARGFIVLTVDGLLRRLRPRDGA